MLDANDRVAVLGAAGFAGGAIATGLASAGYRVQALGRAHADRAIANIDYIQGSIEDAALLSEIAERSTHIVYVASRTTPGTSARDPALEVIGNLLPLARVLEHAHAQPQPQRRLVYLSSGGTVYGDLAHGASESMPLRPRSYYGAGKVAAEAMIHACVSTSDWSATVLRPTNLYGPGQHTARGFAVVPTLFERARDGRAFQIWGSGANVRDYCYIDDLVDAVRRALAPSSRRFSAYNVASGCTASVLDLVAACEKASCRRIATVHEPARSVDVARVSPDATAIRSELCWQPRVGLEDGLLRTWHWMESQHGRTDS